MQNQNPKTIHGPDGYYGGDATLRTYIARRARLERVYEDLRRRFIGKQFKNITVLQQIKNHGGASLWLVKCICGTEQIVGANRLINMPKEKRFRCPACDPKLCPTKITWRAIIKRNKERSIPVCQKWLNYDGFLVDMGLRPKGQVIDRINNQKGYFKSNCRWATYFTSTENRRNTVWLKIRGKRMRIKEAALKFGVKEYLIYNRLRAGWTGADLLIPMIRSGFDKNGQPTCRHWRNKS